MFYIHIKKANFNVCERWKSSKMTYSFFHTDIFRNCILS